MFVKLQSYFKSLCLCERGEGIHDKCLCLLLIVYARSWHRVFVGWFTATLISFFSQNGQVRVAIRVNGNKVLISLRKNNGADYRMAIDVLLLDEYQLPSNMRFSKIIDGGANIGSFSILAHQFYPDAKLVCFEPERSNFRQLKLNMTDNKIPALLKEEAVWFEDCQLGFKLDESHKGFVTESVSDVMVRGGRPQIIDNTLLKMDIEGGEFAVLIPLLEKADCRPPIILLEVHWGKELDTLRNEEFINSLQNLGYTLSPEPDCSIYSQVLILQLD